MGRPPTPYSASDLQFLSKFLVTFRSIVTRSRVLNLRWNCHSYVFLPSLVSHLYLFCCQPPSSGKTPNFGTILHTSTTWGWIYRVCCSNGPNKIHSLANLTQKFVREIKMHFLGGNAISWNAYKWADFCKLLMTKMQMTLLFLAPLDYCWHWLKLNNFYINFYFFLAPPPKHPKGCSKPLRQWVSEYYQKWERDFLQKIQP